MPVPIHEKPKQTYSFDRLKMLWERYPQYHERVTFASLEELLAEHDSYQKDFDDVREEYIANQYERFLVQLSWTDLSYRYAAMEKIAQEPDAEEFRANPYVKDFMSQFEYLDTDHKACFLFPESFLSQFFVILEVCKRAEEFRVIRNLFPDEEKVHYSLGAGKLRELARVDESASLSEPEQNKCSDFS